VGDTGGADGGSTTTIGGAGTGSDDEYPHPIASSNGCQCVADSSYSFSCVATLDAALAHAPDVCARLDSSTRRSTCDNGGFIFRTIEGDENDFVLVLDANGAPAYYQASGYIGGCGVAQQYGYGRIEAGTLPAECGDAYTCAPCADGVTDVPACAACAPSAEDVDGVALSLAEYCQSSFCPASAAVARTWLAASCNVDQRPVVTRGCGVVAIRWEAEFGVVVFYYDGSSGDLVGVFEQDAVPRGPCHVLSYRAGDVPAESCSTATVCEFCTPSGNGAGGAGGEAGSGSATDACLP
jgi:hypothetical protein